MRKLILSWSLRLRSQTQIHSQKTKKCNNQSKQSNNQSQLHPAEITTKGTRVWPAQSCTSHHVCCDLSMEMSFNFSPLLSAHTPPSHKVCDVAHSSGMKGQTLLSQADSAVLCCDSPEDRAHLWPDAAEGSSGMERLLRKCQIRNQLVRECLAECLGVFVLIVSICYGSVGSMRHFGKCREVHHVV